jgi:bacterioferritin-associated ferredoxin
MIEPPNTPPARRPQPMVNRCVCHDVAFADILTWSARREATTLEDVRLKFGCGNSCATCVPYIRQALESGVSSVPLKLDTGG